MKLRKYQAEAIEQIDGSIAMGSTELCLDAPTAFGKTLTAAHFIKDQLERGNSVVFLMNLTALVQQTIDELKGMEIPFKVIAAEFDGQEFDHRANVTICMQQTLHARIEKIEPPSCDVLIVDEFHRSFRTDTMEEVKRFLKPDIILGLSATPYDEKGYALPDVDLIQTTSVKILTEQKFLTPMKVMSVKFAEEIDYSDAGSGEYSDNYLDGKINNESYNSEVVNAWEKTAKGKKTLAFCSSIAHAEALAHQFALKGYEAMPYHSKQSKNDSRAIMEDFKSKKIKVLCSVGKILVGFNDPSVECGIACRPTKTRRVWQQACGRLIRLFDTKTEAILLDCSAWTSTHGFYDDPYYAPPYGNKEELSKAKEKAAVTVTELLLNKGEPTEIIKELVDNKVEELKRNAERIPEISMIQLVSIYNTSTIPEQIATIAYEMNMRITGTTYRDSQVLWTIEDWLVLFEEFPMYKQRLIQTMRTMFKNKVSARKKLAALHYSPNWLREQTPYSYKYETDSTDVSEETYNAYNDIDEDEIPF